MNIIERLENIWKRLICILTTVSACIGGWTLMGLEEHLGLQTLGLFCIYTAIWVMVKSKFYGNFNFNEIL